MNVLHNTRVNRAAHTTQIEDDLTCSENRREKGRGFFPRVNYKGKQRVIIIHGENNRI